MALQAELPFVFEEADATDAQTKKAVMNNEQGPADPMATSKPPLIRAAASAQVPMSLLVSDEELDDMKEDVRSCFPPFIGSAYDRLFHCAGR